MRIALPRRFPKPGAVAPKPTPVSNWGSVVLDRIYRIDKIACGATAPKLGSCCAVPLARASGPAVAAWVQAPCVDTTALWLRHGAPDWKTASGG